MPPSAPTPVNPIPAREGSVVLVEDVPVLRGAVTLRVPENQSALDHAAALYS